MTYDTALDLLREASPYGNWTGASHAGGWKYNSLWRGNAAWPTKWSKRA